MKITRAMEFATDRSRGVLLTVGAGGLPQSSNIVYATWDGQIHISVTDGRVKTRNLRRDPRGVLHVSSDDFWSWVAIEGDAVLSDVAAEPGDSATGLLRRVYETVSGPHPDWDEFDRAMVADKRLVITLVPTHAYGQLG